MESVNQFLEGLASHPTLRAFNEDMDVCRVCKKPDHLSRCARCKSVIYDSPECQKGDWKAHKDACARAVDIRARAQQMLKFRLELDGATATAELSSLSPRAPSGVDLDAVARVTFAVNPASLQQDQPPCDEDCDGEDIDPLASLAKLSKLAQGEMRASVPVASAAEVLAAMVGREERAVECPAAGEPLRLRFAFPLDSPCEFALRPERGYLTKADIALAVSSLYGVIYGVDRVSALFGTRLHSIDDLTLHSIYQTGPSSWEVVIDA